MVSVVMLVHRSSRGKDGFGLESKESKKDPNESMQIELKSKTLTLGEKSGGAYQGLTTVSNAELYTEPVRRRNRENGPPLAGIQLPVRARLRAPQRGRSTAARSHGGECARRRMDPRRRRHPSRPTVPLSPPLSGCRRSWREERGRERMILGFGARRRRRGF